jgi:hypothetical protein
MPRESTYTSRTLALQEAGARGAGRGGNVGGPGPGPGNAVGGWGDVVVRAGYDAHRWASSRPQAIVLGVCGMWVVLWFLFLYSITHTADSPALRQRLLEFANEGATFVRIREYKQCLGFLADVMEFVPHTGRCQGAHWPDFFGQAHHEGVILEVAAGEVSRFLHMEFAKEGLAWSLHDGLPSLSNLLPMSAAGPWRERRIDPSDGDPRLLAVYLKHISGWRYNLLTFNCNTFADTVFDFYRPAPAPVGESTITAAIPMSSALVGSRSQFSENATSRIILRGTALDADVGPFGNQAALARSP